MASNIHKAIAPIIDKIIKDFSPDKEIPLQEEKHINLSKISNKKAILFGRKSL